MNALLIALMWIRCEHRGLPSTPLSSNHISINNSQPGFASRYASKMIGLSVRAAREHLQFVTSFLFLPVFTMAHSCFYLIIFSSCSPSHSVLLLSSASSHSYFSPPQNHATFHPFIHFSHDSSVSVERDCLVVHVYVYV